MPIDTCDGIESAACSCKILIVYRYLKFQCLYQACQADQEAFYPVSAPGFCPWLERGQSV